MPNRSAALLLCVALASACAHRPRGPDGAPLWISVTSPHFTLLADTSPDEARRFALQLERVLLAYRLGSWSAANAPWRSPRMLVLADNAALRVYFKKGLAGMATQDLFGAPIMVISAEQDPSTLGVLKHELAHTVDSAFLVRQPRWLSEGLACNLETMELDSDGRSATFGAVNLDRLPTLRTMATFDFDKVMAAGPEIYAQPERDVQDFYAQSWLLVHLLIQHHRAEFDAFLQRLARGEDPALAFAAALPGVTTASLAQEAVAYLQMLAGHGTYQRYRVPLPVMDWPLDVYSLTPAERLTAQAEIGWAATYLDGLPGGREQAVLDAQAALQQDPGDARALAIEQALTKQERAAQIAAIRAVTVAAPDDPHGWRLLSRALADSPADAAERAQAIETAAAKGPEDPWALAELAVQRVQQRRFDEGLAIAQKAALLAPTDPNALQAFAISLASAGRCAEADRVQSRAIDVLPDRVSPRTLAQLRGTREQLAAACKGMSRPAEAPSSVDAANAQPLAPGQSPRRIAASVQPKRTCKTEGFRVVTRISARANVTATVRYVVRADGSIGGFTGDPKVPKEVNDAIFAYLRGCTIAAGPGLVLPAEQTETFRLDSRTVGAH